jgi:hypothetical protein
MLDYYPEPTMVNGVRTYEVYPKDLSPVGSDPELAPLIDDPEPAPFELEDLPDGGVRAVPNPEYPKWKRRQLNKITKKKRTGLKPIPRKPQSAPKKSKPTSKTRASKAPKKPVKKLSLYEQMCANTGRDVAKTAPMKWKVLYGDVGRKQHSIRTKLLSNQDVDLNVKKIVAWCEEIGWSNAQPLFMIYLAGNQGIYDVYLNTLLGYDYNYKALLKHNLIWKEKYQKSYLLFSNIEKTPPPENIQIPILANPETENSRVVSRTRARSRAGAVNERAHGALSGHTKLLTNIVDPNKSNLDNRINDPSDHVGSDLNSKLGLWPIEANPIVDKEKAKAKKKRSKKKLRAAPQIPEPKTARSDAARPDPRQVFRETKKRKPRKGSTGRTGWKKEPSLNPRLNNWRMKKNPNRWNALDWTGYWLHLWKKCYGEEDPLFVGQRLAASYKQAKRGRGWKCQYYKLGYLLVGVRDGDQCFCGDGQKAKAYLEWLLGSFAEEADWLESPLTYKQATKKTDNWFLNQFKTKSIKPKNRKKPKQEQWSPWGYSS